MSHETDLEKITFHYPIRVEPEHNTFAVRDVTNSTTHVLTIEPGLYSPATSLYSQSASEFRQLVNDLINDAIDDTLVIELNEYNGWTYDASNVSVDLELLFNDSQWTIPLEYFGYTSPQQNELIFSGSTQESPCTVHGSWVVPSTMTGEQEEVWNEDSQYGVTDYRIYPDQDISVSDDGSHPLSYAYDPILEMTVDMVNVPAALVRKRAVNDADEALKVYTDAARVGNEVNTLEYFWRVSPTFNDLEEDTSSLSVRLDYTTGDSFEARMVWTDTNQVGSFGNLIADQPSSYGEKYEIGLNFITFESQVAL